MFEIYVDDKLATGRDEFMSITDKNTEELESKPRDFPALVFTGVMINPYRLAYVLEQNVYSDKIHELPGDCDFNFFRTVRHSLGLIT